MNPPPHYYIDNQLLIYECILIFFRCICLMAFEILQSIIVIDNYSEFYLSLLVICRAFNKYYIFTSCYWCVNFFQSSAISFVTSWKDNAKTCYIVTSIFSPHLVFVFLEVINES